MIASVDGCKSASLRVVRRVEVADALPAEIENLAILERPRRTIGHVVQGYETAGHPVGDFGAGRDRKPVVHGPALVRLDVPERDPAELVEGDDARRRLRDEREHLAWTAMKQQRLVGLDDELVEREASRRGDLGHIRRQAVDPVGDLVDSCLHQNGTSVVSRPVPAARPERIRQNSTASSSIVSPPAPATYEPPARPESVSVNGCPCRRDHSATTSATTRPS